ncbi:hypothetical protein ACEN4P_09180 [Marinilactibacillus psychrotolerans]|uniref:hypothetical protein n=1 Tax=Marinilactibacillus psychrotolerans TaxID=191770 RepID=UPI00388B7387
MIKIETNTLNGIPIDALMGLIGSFGGIIVSAIVSYIVSKNNIKSQKESIDKQIDAEIEKIRMQYQLEQKRDNNNYLNKFKIEKLAELYELLGQFGRYNTEITLLTQNFLRESQLYFEEKDIDLFKRKKDQIEKRFFDRNTMREISILVNYFPKIRIKWETIVKLQLKYVTVYPDQIIGSLIIKQDRYENFKIPDNYTLNNYFDDLELIQIKSIDLLEHVTKETEYILNKLSE